MVNFNFERILTQENEMKTTNIIEEYYVVTALQDG